jgi:uncharacterized protein YuzE
MEKLNSAFPDLLSDLTLALSARPELIAQLNEASVVRVSFDEEADAGYIHVQAGRALNAVEQRIIGAKHAKTLPLDGREWANLDLDNFGRVTGIEILTPPADVGALMRSRASV